MNAAAMPSPSALPPPALSPQRLLQAIRREDPDGRRRVSLLELDRQRFWVKRPERMEGDLRLRLQKGSPRRGFERERAALHYLAGRGLPAPPLTAEGPDFMVVPDRGIALSKLLRKSKTPHAERLAACGAAGAALAAFHRAGLAHGRPLARDICWSDERVTMIDYERFDAGRNGLGRLRNDLLMLVYSVVLEVGPTAPETRALCAAYLRDAPPAVWPAARRLARRLLWLGPLIRLAELFDGRPGEVAAVLPTLRLFAAPAPRAEA